MVESILVHVRSNLTRSSAVHHEPLQTHTLHSSPSPRRNYSISFTHRQNRMHTEAREDRSTGKVSLRAFCAREECEVETEAE